MKKINASVVIPSHRFDAPSMRRLILTVDLFLNQGFEVVIADNSGFVEKQRKLREEFGDVIVFAETEADCKAMDNFLAAFAAASRDYIVFATDDDTFFPVGIEALATAIANSTDEVGFCAPTVRYAHEGTSIANAPDLSSESLTERLTQWIFCDIAVSFYGCYSRQIWQRYFNFARQHPLKFAHHDQLLRFVLADSGRITSLNTAWFAYDYSNWSNGQIAYQSLEHYYTKVGFDERMIYVHSLLEGLEGALCQLKLDELAGREFQYVAINSCWWNGWLEAFKQTIDYHRDSMSLELWLLLEPLVNYVNTPDDANIYQILQLLSEFLQGVYGTDGGLQHFWLHQSADSLRIELVA
jgi:glycosyltransferase involved in cell wall biosynthesis